ncbi:hypothetical protein A2482_04685 [Candidatus Falkowbacteria bacterium RIFOXYC2_FULL_48_21]|uniref:Uncharacterized protein n=1 Tax=Candidatus Falkowbacteria bacterium RIFOXYC2_FULL_48_21 TaxID=1798005 RepID=A0A1F5T7W1_9BACT|nr:MAG: hypothetical protein A2482_04685 [Candidatus Falkowbacteria bacterium RIFOXYC2_FULL_48_21]
MGNQKLIFSETDKSIEISGAADIFIFKNSGDILASRPFDMHVGIQGTAIIGFEREGDQVVLRWKQLGVERKTPIGHFEPGHEIWLEKIKQLYP